MAGKLSTAQGGTGILLVTANVGSLFEDPDNLQKTWLKEFYQTVQSHKPHFLAVHCQEVGGKNYEASMSHVDTFVKEMLSSDAMKEYSRARVYLDENYKSQEHFTALGSFYFIHESLKNIQQFDFKAKKYRKVVGKETCSETLESTPSLEKEKFPQDYFPESLNENCWSVPVEQFHAGSDAFSFHVCYMMVLSVEQSCADVVMKSTSARVSSWRSPLICQARSNARLCTYMQNRWNQPAPISMSLANSRFHPTSADQHQSAHRDPQSGYDIKLIVRRKSIPNHFFKALFCL